MTYHPFEEPYPFEDQPVPQQRSAWKRHRPGTSRHEWNKEAQFLRPGGAWEPQCWSCGYRDYAGAMLDVKGMLCCFSCWLEETHPGEGKAYWDKIDAGKIDPAKGTRTTSSGLTGLPADFGTGKRR